MMTMIPEADKAAKVGQAKMALLIQRLLACGLIGGEAAQEILDTHAKIIGDVLEQIPQTDAEMADDAEYFNRISASTTAFVDELRR